MKASVGSIDRILRLVAGAAVIAFGYMGGLASPWNAVAIGGGSVFVLTALIKFCALSLLLGINTCGAAKVDYT